jgi:glycosyltransferase involved in cell wall biosynthesis
MAPTFDEPRILGIVEGDPFAPLTLSGVPGFLLDALEQQFPVVGRIDYGLRGARRLATAAMTFTPQRSRWRHRYHLAPRAYRALTETLVERLERFDAQYDLVFQVHSWAGGQPRPYVLYVDQTRTMAERGWPEWFPMSRSARTAGRTLEHSMYTGAEHIFVMGTPARESLISDYGIEPGRITLTGGGVNFTTLPQARAEPGPESLILFIGREFERKGGKVLLEAFRAVRERVPAASLHVVGTERRIAQPGVVCHGRLAGRDRVADLYRRARVLCAPSLYEPWGLVFMEAMAYGTPCVGTTVQSIPEILAGGRAGVLVPPGDATALAEALLRVLRDDDFAHQLSIAGREHVERYFTWDRVVERMAPALRSACQQTEPSAS